MGACLGDAPWYLNGRPFGNSGPGRRLRRESRTARIAASVDGDFLMGGRNANWDVGMSYSRAQGNLNLPAVYTDRIYRSFRDFGEPDCGVGVTADRTSPAGMTLGPLGGAVAGQGPCMYYNPFSNAIQRSDQPGAPFRNTDNPDYVPAPANPEALRLWLNEEVDLVSTTDLFVADATLSGNLVENVADFAVGYQYRGTHADGDPNDSGDVTRNPCPVAGDMDCPAGVRFGPYLFTNVHRPYAADQQVQRLFGELALGLGPRVDTQLAANYEFYNVAGSRVNSFDPKVGWRIQAAENLHYSLAFRGSVQTTFRTPSLDDLNTSPLTTLEWINETGAYQAVDRFGRTDLLPERAFTYNAGTVLFLEGGVEATVDYWHYDFDNVIGSMPYDAITSLYASDDPATRAAVSPFIVCPGGRASDLAPADRCIAQNLQRIQIDLVNWPGLTTSGIDTHFAARTDAGPGQFSGDLGLHLHARLQYQGAAAGGRGLGPLRGTGVRRLPELRPSHRGAAAALEEPLVGLLCLEQLHAGELPELHLLLRRSGRQHHRAGHRPVPHPGRELPVALPGQRDEPDPLRDEPDRADSALGQHRAVLRRVHARPEGAAGQDGAELALRRMTASHFGTPGDSTPLSGRTANVCPNTPTPSLWRQPASSSTGLSCPSQAVRRRHSTYRMGVPLSRSGRARLFPGPGGAATARGGMAAVECLHGHYTASPPR